ncbi:GspE/PulE family protein [Azospirillum doebereinerae]|uniref:Type II/IV secretion system protein n=2 Tax=Azospirillum doebereinerae TaxID=92933 RepID=A0A3S0V6Q0_9PROT|nr:GspE/PulE family protein [Azospirillum doebereinerae]RUQ72175.1 type II/IV secretion system protein [Azospirillum doebereinerae]
MPVLKPSSAFREELAGYLLRKGLVTRGILDAALAEQRVTGESLGAILVRNGFLARADLNEAQVSHETALETPTAMGGTPIPLPLLERHAIIVTGLNAETVQVATLHEESVAERVIAAYYPGKAIQFSAFVPDQYDEFLDRVRRSQNGEEDGDPVGQLVARAIEAGASDIHIVPRRKTCSVFLRVDGIRRLMDETAAAPAATMAARIKDRSGMDLAERRLPQEGRFEVEHQGRPVDLRVTTVPSVDGEIIVLRLLDAERVQPNLDTLGLSRVAEWRRSVDRRHGLCLVCGPTGSGKSTTLTATVREMDRLGRAIYSIEDPVEYRMAYTGQVNVNPAVKLDFARVVRTFMRADPDVIVLGEVRDEETAQIAVRAADTGHMVLTTLHTGSVNGAIDRLRHLGVPPHDIKGLLRGVMVQSLIRTTCQDCHGAGCPACGGGGYAGRTAISECAVFDDSAAVVAAAKGGRNWPTLFDDAVAKFHAGLTTAAELRRVFGSEASGMEPRMPVPQPPVKPAPKSPRQ